MKKLRNIWVVKFRNTWVVEVRSKWVVKVRIRYIFGFSKFTKLTKDFVTVGYSWVVKV